MAQTREEIRAMLTDYENWQIEIYKTEPMRLETDTDDIIDMYLDEKGVK